MRNMILYITIQFYLFEYSNLIIRVLIKFIGDIYIAVGYVSGKNDIM